MTLKAGEFRQVGRIMLFLALVIFAYTTIAGAASMTTTLAKKTGKVEVKMPNEVWKEAQAGMKLTEGSSIRTSAGAEAFIKWSNGDIIKISPLSELKLSKLQASGKVRNSEVSLLNGRTFARVNKLASDKSTFTIRTPTAIAGVRGTGFDGSFKPGWGAQFSVLSGSIAVEAEGVTVEVQEGMMSQINIGEPPMAPEPAPPTVIDTLRADDSQSSDVSDAPEVSGTTETTGAATTEQVEEAIERTVDTVDDDVEQVIQNQIEQTGTEEAMQEAGTLIITIE